MTSITDYIKEREEQFEENYLPDIGNIRLLQMMTDFNKQTIAGVLRMVKKEILNDDWEVENEYERGFVAMMHKALAILGSIEDDIINNKDSI